MCIQTNYKCANIQMTQSTMYLIRIKTQTRTNCQWLRFADGVLRKQEKLSQTRNNQSLGIFHSMEVYYPWYQFCMWRPLYGKLRYTNNCVSTVLTNRLLLFHAHWCHDHQSWKITMIAKPRNIWKLFLENPTLSGIMIKNQNTEWPNVSDVWLYRHVSVL